MADSLQSIPLCILMFLLLVPLAGSLELAGNDGRLKDTEIFKPVEGSIFIHHCNTSSRDAFWTNEENFSKKEKTLSFMNINRTDSGRYQCFKTPRKEILLETVYIDVQYPARILGLSKGNNPLHEYQTFSLEVKVEGKPLPNTTFTSDVDGSVAFWQDGEGSITVVVYRVQCNDGGPYHVTATNSLANDSRAQEIQVFCAPGMYPRDPSQELHPRLGKNVELKVFIMGFPFPNVTWTHSGKVVPSENSHFESDVMLSEFSMDDFGLYSLQMVNDLGQFNGTYQVTADGPPDPVTGLTVNNVTMFSANISFMSGYDYGARQTFTIQAFNGDSYNDIASFEDDSKDHLPRTVSHVITDLKVGIKYNLSVVPQNSRGKGLRSSTFVSITTKEVVERENLTIPCNTSGTNDTHWETKDGTRLTNGPMLEVYFISRNYTGVYKCVGNTTGFINEERILEEAYIDVQYPAKILNMSAGPNYLEANETLVIELLVEGHPAPNIALLNTRAGKVVFSSNQTGAVNVTMESVQCTDLGTYQLTVSNRLGNESRKEDIYVYCPPVVDPKAHVQTSFYPRIGNHTIIKIENYGYPYPNYTWHHNKSTITKHIDSEFGSSIDLNVTASDFGSYDVDMSNEYGDVTVTFQVIPTGVPDPVTDMNVDKFTYNSAILSWTSGFNYGSQQTFLLQRQDDGKYIDLATFPDRSSQGLVRGNYTVTGLDSSTPYTLTVVSSNRDGNSTRSRGTLQFTTAAAPSHHKNHHTGAIVGGVIGSLCALGLLIAIYLKIRKDRRRRYQNLGEE